jgi:hypothetical protein
VTNGLSEMKATVPQSSIGKLSVRSVDVGEVDAGPISIAKLVLDSIHLDVSTGAVTARNVNITIGVTLSLDWSVGVSIDGIGSWGWNGTIDLGSQSATVPLGNLDLTGLKSLDFDIASLAVSDVEAVVGAIRDLKLGPLVAEQIAAQSLVLPDAGFAVTGLGLGSVEVEGLSVPAATGAQVTIGHAHGDALPLGTVTIPGLSFPRASIGDVVSDQLDASGDPDPYLFTADAGVLSVTLSVAPSAELTMDELRISNLRASASVGAVTLQDVVLPYDVFNIKLSQLGIDSLAVPALEVS